MYVYVYYTTLPGTFGTLNPECASQQNVPASTVATLTSHLFNLIYSFLSLFSPTQSFPFDPTTHNPHNPHNPHLLLTIL